MSNNQWDDDDDNDNDDIASQLPKAARAHLRKLEKQNQELLERLNKADANSRQATVKDVLTAQKADPRLAKWAIPDLGDNVTEESVKGWLAENADMLGGAKPASDTAAPADEPDLSGLAAMQVAEQSGTSGHTTPDAEAVQRIKSAYDQGEGRFDSSAAMAALNKTLAEAGMLATD